MTVAFDRRAVRAVVASFYEELPFNVYDKPSDAAVLVQRGNPVAAYPPIDLFLRRHDRPTVLDVGCGAGWFANACAFHYGAQVSAVDLCGQALAFAGGLSGELSTTDRITYLQADLFDLPQWPAPAGFQVVNSLGVLHHTHDCRAALLSLLDLVADGGLLHVGLYHRYGRQPFLELFDDVRALLDRPPHDEHRRRAEAAAFARYRALYPASVTNDTLLRSWFRDQVLHPHETQHTVREVYDWLDGAGFECLATSVNGFAPVDDWRTVFDHEPRLADLSRRRNVVERTYYPGFFTVVARPRRDHGTRGERRRA